jgi:hypothetical protein
MRLRAQVVHRGWPGVADLDVLGRRTYMRAFRLPRRRVLIVSWLDL